MVQGNSVVFLQHFCSNDSTKMAQRWPELEQLGQLESWVNFVRDVNVLHQSPASCEVLLRRSGNAGPIAPCSTIPYGSRLSGQMHVEASRAIFYTP